MSFVEIRAHYSSMSFSVEIVKPHVRIDAGPEFLLPGWGTYRVAVAPGQHLVEVWMVWALFQQMGLNPVTVTVPPDGIQVSWRAPRAGWAKGKVDVGPPGSEPVPYVDPASAAPGAAAVPAVSPAQWAPDPYGRHELRWYDGMRWTESVSDAGATTTDPV